MKNKAPILTYIITVINSFFPATFMTLLASTYVLGTSSDGAKYYFDGFCFQAIVFGYIFCSVVSLIYFYLVRRKKLRPRWWTNLLLIVASYLPIPLLGVAYVKVFGLDTDRYFEAFTGGQLFIEAVLVAIIGFTWIGLSTRKPPTPKVKRKRFKSPLWILLSPVGYYIAFFCSAILSSILFERQFIGTANVMLLINKLLRLPLDSPLTENYMRIHFPGLTFHLVLLVNSLVWGPLFWWVNRRLNRPQSPPKIPSTIQEESE